MNELTNGRKRETLLVIAFFSALQPKDQTVFLESGHISLPPRITPGSPRTEHLRIHNIVAWEGA